MLLGLNLTVGDNKWIQIKTLTWMIWSGLLTSTFLTENTTELFYDNHI